MHDFSKKMSRHFMHYRDDVVIFNPSTPAWVESVRFLVVFWKLHQKCQLLKSLSVEHISFASGLSSFISHCSVIDGRTSEETPVSFHTYNAQLLVKWLSFAWWKLHMKNPVNLIRNDLEIFFQLLFKIEKESKYHADLSRQNKNEIPTYPKWNDF